MIPTTTETEWSDRLVAAVIQRSYGANRNVDVYDDGFGTGIFVYGAEFGPIRVIRAMSWEDAYDIAIDESPTIHVADEHEAYGLANSAELDERVRQIDQGAEYDLDLVEGYRYQSNATGTGIVDVGHHEWLITLDEWNASHDESITPIFSM